MYYPDLSSLRGHTLKPCDVLTIHNMLHIVCCDSLRNLYQDDDQIFKDLGVDKYEFCSKHYAHQSISGEFHYSFPLSKEDNFIGLTNLVIALMELSEEKILQEEKMMQMMKEYLESEDLLYKEVTRKKGLLERIFGF
ncbi:MAG: hypothetical protein NTV03_01170 [Candidatus Nomurabacteria bacterium]|nr:hypothetical protein [Candidatus Nomurabacteria bacterium]